MVPADAMCGDHMDYDSVKKAGSSLGTGSLIVMDETTCMVRTLERISRFYMSESCGQCTPCREGTGWLNRMLKRIIAGQGRSEDITSAGRCGESHRRTHHLRAGRCRGMAGAKFHQALPARVSVHGRAQGPLDRRRRRRCRRRERRGGGGIRAER